MEALRYAYNFYVSVGFLSPSCFQIIANRNLTALPLSNAMPNNSAMKEAGRHRAAGSTLIFFLLRLFLIHRQIKNRRVVVGEAFGARVVVAIDFGEIGVEAGVAEFDGA